MFNDTIIVQTAISTFNNAALVSPMFFWTGILMLPLFFVSYKYGDSIIKLFNNAWLKDLKSRTFTFSLVVLVLIFAWLAFSGGNYGVLRDATSVLPFAIAALLFIITASIIQNLKVINPALPMWIKNNIKYKRVFLWFCFIIGAMLVSLLSGLIAFSGKLMMFAAVFCGGMLGRALKKGANPIFMTTFVMFAISILLLMQPEFFRFGQMGNLTIIHKLALVMVSTLCMLIFAVKLFKPAKKIHNSAYVKIKWLCRFLSLLAVALFLFTESVPVFFGMSFMFFVSISLSVKHLDSLSDAVSKKIWACLLFVYGILTVNFIISTLGCIYLSGLDNVHVKKQLKALL